MLKRIVDEHWFDPKAVIGFWPANAVGDDIALYTGESRDETLATFHTLRQQLRAATASPISRSPISSRRRRAARPITSAPSSSPRARRRARSPNASPRANDDYGSIMVKALADRIAEAFAERMHERVRARVLGLCAPTRR